MRKQWMRHCINAMHPKCAQIVTNTHYSNRDDLIGWRSYVTQVTPHMETA